MPFYHSRSSLHITLRILIVVSAFVGTPVDASEGFVLRSGEGEDLDGMLVKASPETGTTGSILIQQTFSAGAKTSLHVHDYGDELFYVIAGKGEATLGERTVSIGAGDVILAPRGTHHRIRNVSDDSELDIVFFMDRPDSNEGAEKRGALQRFTFQRHQGNI